MQKLLDNSVFIAFGLCALSLAILNVNSYLKTKGYSLRYAGILLQTKLVRQSRPMLKKLLASIVLTVVISLFVFRQVWNTDNFIVIVLTYILAPWVAKALAALED